MAQSVRFRTVYNQKKTIVRSKYYTYLHYYYIHTFLYIHCSTKSYSTACLHFTRNISIMMKFMKINMRQCHVNEELKRFLVKISALSLFIYVFVTGWVACLNYFLSLFSYFRRLSFYLFFCISNVFVISYSRLRYYMNPAIHAYY